MLMADSCVTCDRTVSVVFAISAASAFSGFGF